MTSGKPAPFAVRFLSMRYLLPTILTLYLLLAGGLGAQESVEKHLPVEGLIAQNGTAVELNWLQATPKRVGAVTVKRRLLGETGANSWRVISPVLGSVMRFTDKTVEVGVAYEYQILRSAGDIVDVGYWATGVDLPAVDSRGTVYVIVDDTIAKELAPRLTRFSRDLTGDGWTVVRQLAPRGDLNETVESLKKAVIIKQWLDERHSADPFGRHVVVLVGHLPIVFSGKANPDGHGAVPHPTDLFYADRDSRWAISPEGALLNNRLPTDFIEMQIGRIDFAAVSDGQRDLEVHLLQNYFDKNHHWRMGLIGDLRDAYGDAGHLAGEVFGLYNIVGPQAVRAGGHHDVGEEQPWLWGVDFGDWNGPIYAETYSNKAVFAINFGSGKQRIDSRFNPMTALLAQPYTIAVGWGARPAWWLHHMALGGTIGDVHMRTVNNGRAEGPYREMMDYYPTGQYLWRNPIWVNLLGDPTARAFPLAPATQLRAVQTDLGVALSWTASDDEDVMGYKVYRASGRMPDFVLLTGDKLVSGTDFLDVPAPSDAHYMVRAYGKKDVYAGSFFTFSQGAFTQISVPALVAPDVRLITASGHSVALPDTFNARQNGEIHAVIEGPTIGQLRYEEGAWRYTPARGFTGEVPLRYSISNSSQTDSGLLVIEVQ